MGASQQLELADRLANLGTETAFAVSKAAAEWAAAGNEVFPFHLGDIGTSVSSTEPAFFYDSNIFEPMFFC